ncbi:MAG: hypothetical protein ACC662_06725 [Planctomycetota bacterium]
MAPARAIVAGGAVGGPLVRSLNRMTGQRVRDARDWIDLYQANKKRPKDLFVGEREKKTRSR